MWKTRYILDQPALVQKLLKDQPRKQKPLPPKSKATSKDAACRQAWKGRVCCTGFVIRIVLRASVGP